MRRRGILGVLLAGAIVACQTTPPPTPTAAVESIPPPTATPVPSPPNVPTQTPMAVVQPTPSPQPTLAPSPSTPATEIGGTLHLLMTTDAANGGIGFQDVDPQRIYAGEDLAFLGATIMRSLTTYTYSPDLLAADTLVPDAATDTGRPNADFTQWTFTIRDGIKWQDGSPVECEDFKYGVSRTFAQDVIVGPGYAIQYLDIPTEPDGSSRYKGPYDGTGQDLFDEAVICNGTAITFRLNQPVPDFNYTVTLGFSAVPNPTDHPNVDTADAYDTPAPGSPWSDGPYMIDSYAPGAGGSLVLKRNPFWDPSTDANRAAYPDEWDVKFVVVPAELVRGFTADDGEYGYSLTYDPMPTSSSSSFFADPQTALPQFADRAFSDYNGYASYIWIRTDKVPNQLVRQAMATALDRGAIRSAAGGEFALDFADGVLVPTIGRDYAPTHLWDADGPFGEAIPPTGNSDLAKRLIEQSGEQRPTVQFGYNATSPTGSRVAEIVQRSLDRAGFNVKLFGYGPTFFGTIPGDFGMAGFGADWADASTVIPVLFSEIPPSYDLSHVSSDNYPDFESSIQDAFVTPDPQARAAKWQALNNEIGEQMFVIPTFFQRAQYLAGSNVGGLYRWAPYASWPYGQLYAKH